MCVCACVCYKRETDRHRHTQRNIYSKKSFLIFIPFYPNQTPLGRAFTVNSNVTIAKHLERFIYLVLERTYLFSLLWPLEGICLSFSCEITSKLPLLMVCIWPQMYSDSKLCTVLNLWKVCMISYRAVLFIVTLQTLHRLAFLLHIACHSFRCIRLQENFLRHSTNNWVCCDYLTVVQEKQNSEWAR